MDVTKITDREILELYRQWEIFNEESRSHTLWITCSDFGMDRGVERIMNTEAALILRRPCSRVHPCQSSEEDQISVIDYAISSLNVTNIMVCGHFRCDSLRQPVPVIPPVTSFMGSYSSDRFPMFLQQMNDRQTLLDETKQNVVHQMSNLMSYPSVLRGLHDGQLNIHGMFYIGESGFFLRYDEESDEFVTLQNSDSRYSI